MITPRLIIRLTAEQFGLKESQLLVGGRPGWIAWPRQVAMALTYEMCLCQSQQSVAEAFGKKAHRSVRDAAITLANRCDTEPKARVAVEQLRKTILERGRE